jgi:hypothetical protein
MHFCKICNYFTSSFNSLKIHFKTQKHLDNTKPVINNNTIVNTNVHLNENINENPTNQNNEIDTRLFRCDTCNKKYIHKSGLSRHKIKCEQLHTIKQNEKDSKTPDNITTITNNNTINNINIKISKIDFLNENFDNVLNMNTFMDNYQNNYGLTKEQTETLLYNYQNSGINSCINSLIFYLKKSGILQYKDIYGEEISMKDIILHFLLSDQSMRCHFEKCNDKWNKTTSTESINQLINITDDHIYKHQKQYLALNGLEKKKLINGVLRSTSYSALSEISNPD